MIGLLFDLDGTLFDSEQMAYRTYREVLSRLFKEGLYHRRDCSDLEIKNILGMVTTDGFSQLMPGAPMNVVRRAVDILNEVEQANIKNEASLFPGVQEELPCLLDEGYSLFVASNGGAEYVTSVLEKHQIARYFTEIYSAGMHQTKSKVDLVRLILQKHPMKAVMIGDRSSDIEAGKKNLLFTIGCSYGFGSMAEIRGADYIAHSFFDIRKVLKKLKT